MKGKIKGRRVKKELIYSLLTTFTIIITLVLSLSVHAADPVGPIITYISQSTGVSQGGTPENNASIKGGIIATINLDSTQVNKHWKAYVGNVTATLTLDDADNYSIYVWSSSSVSGVIHATRSSSITWADVVCANDTDVQAEMVAMNHTDTYLTSDKINDTFNEFSVNNSADHEEFWVAGTQFFENTCNFTTQTYINDTSQTPFNQTKEYFEEILLSDKNATHGLIYATIIDQDAYSYRTGTKYDFQLLLPERGDPAGQSTNTIYYLYLEIL